MKRLMVFLFALICGALAVVMTAGAAANDSLLAVNPHHWKQVPVGFTMADLEHWVLTPGSIRSIDAELSTAKGYGANTIRLQIVQDRLVGRYGHQYNAAYMADIEAVVSYGRELGLTMVLNDQTEPAPHFKVGERLPTHATHVFWQDMMNVYANAPGIVFDLFNEPRRCSWAEWRVKFQPLVSFINAHADNQIWLEGRRYASALLGIPKIYGKHLVLTYHHPGAPWPEGSPTNPVAWDEAFGYAADQGQAVVDAEFVDSRKSYHLPYNVVRQYLAYAKERHIGLLVFGLAQHNLITQYRKG